jgi:hypothetical protein
MYRNWTYPLFPHDQVVDSRGRQQRQVTGRPLFTLLDRAACLRPACSSASRNNANDIVAVRTLIGRLEIDLTFYAIYDISADPDFVATPSQVNATRSLHRGALCGDVRRWRKSGTNKPLCQTSIQTSGDRIFVSPATDERPHFECSLVARPMWPNHAELQWMKGDPIGLE